MSGDWGAAVIPDAIQGVKYFLISHGKERKGAQRNILFLSPLLGILIRTAVQQQHLPC